MSRVLQLAAVEKDMQILAAVLENGNMGKRNSLHQWSDLMILFFPRGSESVCVH